MTGAAPLRIVVGDDDVLLREGIVRILGDAGMDVVAVSGDADDLTGKVLAYRPDLAVIDIRMPPRSEDDGLRAALDIRERLPETRILILSQYVDPELALELIGDRADGVGYLLKERVGDVAAFLGAVDRVGAGGSALDPEVVSRMLGRRSSRDPLAELTDREIAVLAAMAEGHSNLGIGRQLFLSQASVEKHVTSIFRKLHISPAQTEHRRVLAVLMYLRRGVVAG